MSQNYLLLATNYLLAMEIIPAIIPQSLEEISNRVERVQGVAKFIQIDITDGVLAGEKSWPLTPNATDELIPIQTEEEGMPYWDNVDYELDLMVSPENMDMEKFMSLGPSRIIFHTKDTLVLEDYLLKTPRGTVQVGVAFDIEDTIDTMKPLFEKVDFVQCMGIAKIGFQGVPFDEHVYENISKIRDIYPTMPITVDGGVTLENAQHLADAGASRLVVGSAIFNTPDPRASYENFLHLFPEVSME